MCRCSKCVDIQNVQIFKMCRCSKCVDIQNVQIFKMCGCSEYVVIQLYLHLLNNNIM